MKQNRIVYFDIMRIVGMFFVIYMHVASLPLSGEINGEWLVLSAVTSLAYIAVPLFFMMSGYLILTSEKTKDISVLIRHRLPHLIIPLMFWTIIIALWITFKNREISLGNI